MVDKLKTSQNMKTYLPLHQRYLDIKAAYLDVLMLFRVGNFYETIGNDALNLNVVLGTALSTHTISKNEQTSISGFTHDNLDTYLLKLVKAGYRVGIVDEVKQ